MLADSGSSQVRRAIVTALRDPAGVAALPTAELDFTIRVMRRARLLGRLAWQLREAGILESLPVVAGDALLGALASAESQAHAVLWELDRIAWALRELAEVPLVAVKGGAYLLAGLPNARGRMLADTDVMVPEARLAEIEARLKSCGWRGKNLTPYDDNYYRLWTHELPPLVHEEREVEVDLHHNVLMRTARYKPDAALLLAASRSLPGLPYRVLDPVDMVLHAMTHLFCGEMDMALRELVDIDVLLRHFGASETGFWERFWPRAEALNLPRPAFLGLHFASAILATPVPQVVQAQSWAGMPTLASSVLNRLVPPALFPQHPELRSRGAEAARLVLYIRAHWLRMPPGLLARHLTRKSWLRMQGGSRT
jgi:hypothetical protein